ncbi:tetratricopeptide repeat protein [Mucilaginibacter sp. PAMB04274]|uniref:tetratricopeptide repeat protein n=1 Tax=Mucilaginibacter sp. PAMB04274 TaxID=3138568 RepID=UPI0031F658E0
MNEDTKRFAPLKETLTRLFALSGNCCAYPGCSHPLIDEEMNFIAQVCHIEAAMEGGERFNTQQTNEKRRGFDNLMLMCYAHHVRTNNVDKYPVEKLKEIKANHESKFRATGQQFAVEEQLINRVYQDQLESIKNDTTVIRQQTTQLVTEQATHTGISLEILALMKKIDSNSPATAPADLDEEITNIMKYRDGHQHRLAIKQYSDFRGKHWQQLNDRQRYRVLANMGICHLELFEHITAGTMLVEAGKYQPEDLKALNFAALGHAVIGEHDIARTLLQKIFQVSPDDAQAWSTYLQISKGESWSTLLAIMPVPARQDSQVAFMLSKAALDRGLSHEAITWAQVALDAGGETDHDLKGNLAAVILSSIHDPFKVASGQVNRETMNKANYVIRLLDEAWSRLQGTDLAASRSWFLRNRGVAKRILQNRKGCLEDMQEAGRLQQTFEILRETAIIAMELRDSAQALQYTSLASQLAKSASEREDIQLLQAENNSVDGKYAEAIAGLNELLVNATNEQIKTHAYELLIKLLIRIGNAAAADRVIDEVIAWQPERISPYVNKARRCREKGDTVAVIDNLEMAYANVPQATSKEDVHELAMELAKVDAYDKAIRLMEDITDASVLSPLSKDLVRLYFAAGLTKKVFELCQRLINDHGPNQFLTEYMVATYHHINDVPSALRACEQYLAIYPDDQRMIVRLLQIKYQQNDWQAIRVHLAVIHEIDRQLPMEMQYKLAFLFYLCGQKERCYAAAYETRKQFITLLAAHELFFGLLIGHGSTVEHPADPQTAGIGSAVTLTGEDGTTVSWVICPSSTRTLLPDERQEDETIAQLLIGKKPGDRVTLETGQWTIAKIRHRYNYAYQVSMDMLADEQSGSTALRKFSLGTTGNPAVDFQPLFEQLKEQVKQQRYVNSFIATGKMTIGGIAALRQVNPIQIWSELLPFDAPGIQTANGPQEFITARNMLAAGKGMIMDIITLFTLEQLKLLDLVGALTNPLAVSQSTLDVLNDLMRDFPAGKKESKSLLPQGDGFAWQHLTAVDIANQRAKLARLHDWITQRCDVLPCHKAIDLGWSEKTKLNELMGESFVDTALTAREKDYLLFAEEWTFRALAFDEQKVDGIFSLVLLDHFRERSLISQKEYADLVVELISMNYHGIPADSIVVFTALDRFRDVVHPVVLRALGGIHSDLFDGYTSLSIAVNIFYKTVLSPIFSEIYGENGDEQRRRLIFALLGSIAQLYEPDHAIKNNLLLISNELSSTYPGGQAEVDQFIREFFGQFEDDADATAL